MPEGLVGKRKKDIEKTTEMGGRGGEEEVGGGAASI